MKLVIFIKSAGNNISRDNLKDTIQSIIETTKVDFKFYLVLEESQKSCLSEIDNIDNYIYKVVNAKQQNSWAYDFNIFLDSVKSKCEWVLYAHDDVKMLTNGWFDKSLNYAKNRNDIGWITYSQPSWYMHYGEPRSQVARPGFHTDRHKYPCIHECHRLDRKYILSAKGYLKNIEMPKSAVKIHGPYSVFNLISIEKLKKIGYCPDWNPYTMLIDEHFALQSLKNNFINIWIPDIFYLHPLRWHERKSSDRYKVDARNGFNKVWGFDGGRADLSDEEIEDFCKDHLDTNIPWSRGKKSYEWEYLSLEK